MAQVHIALLRGVNLGPRNRVSMSQLRDALEQDGLRPARTYVQSGNIVLRSGASPGRVGARVRTLIEQHFGIDVAVLVRTSDELSEIVARDPLGDVARDPKRYQVSFLERALKADVLARVAAAAAPEERLVALGRELYAWHPAGVARSKLWAALADRKLGVQATARNWSTVCAVAQMAQEL